MSIQSNISALEDSLLMPHVFNSYRTFLQNDYIHGSYSYNASQNAFHFFLGLKCCQEINSEIEDDLNFIIEMKHSLMDVYYAK